MKPIRKRRSFKYLLICIGCVVLYIFMFRSPTSGCRKHSRLFFAYGPISDLHDLFINVFPLNSEIPLKKGSLFRKTSELGRTLHDVKALTEPVLKCKGNYPYIIFVKSSIDNVLSRYTVRNTWGQGNKVMFILGSRPQTNKRIQLENEQYGDILQVNISESYKNITRKLMVSFLWLKNQCSDYKHVILVDDDVLIFPERIYKYLDSEQDGEQNKHYMGYTMRHNRPHRTAFNKWQLSVKEYPYNRYPDYVTGGCVLMSKFFVDTVVDKIPFITDMWVDDIYLGLIAYSADIRPSHVPGMLNRHIAKSEVALPSLLSSHGFSCAEEMFEAWNIYKDFKINGNI